MREKQILQSMNVRSSFFFAYCKSFLKSKELFTPTNEQSNFFVEVNRSSINHNLDASDVMLYRF